MKKRLAILTGVSALCLLWGSAQANPQMTQTSVAAISTAKVDVAEKKSYKPQRHASRAHRRHNHRYSGRYYSNRHGAPYRESYGYDDDGTPFDNVFALLPFSVDEDGVQVGYDEGPRAGYRRVGQNDAYGYDDGDGLFFGIF